MSSLLEGRCGTCAVMKRAQESEEPACCAWFIENVVCGTKSVNDCTEYETVEEGK